MLAKIKQNAFEGVARMKYAIMDKAHNARCKLLRKGIRLKNTVLDKIHGVPDAIVFGENHLDLEQAHHIADEIKKYKPKYVLLEGFNNKTPEDLKLLTTFYKMRTLEDVCKHHGVSLEDLGISEDFVQQVRGKLDKAVRETAEMYRRKLQRNEWEDLEDAKREVYANGHVPKSFEELRNTPLCLLHSYLLDAIHTRIGTKRAEMSGRIGKLDAMCEKLKRVQDHIHAHWDMVNTDGVKARRRGIILGAAADVGAEIAGCDVGKSKIMKEIEEIDDRYLEETENHEELLEQDREMAVAAATDAFINWKKGIERVVYGSNDMREEAMSEIISKHVGLCRGEGTSKKPAIAVVGRKHTCGIGEGLKKAKVNHRIVNLPDLGKVSRLERMTYRG